MSGYATINKVTIGLAVMELSVFWRVQQVRAMGVHKSTCLPRGWGWEMKRGGVGGGETHVRLPR